MTQIQLLKSNQSLLSLMRTNSMRVKDIELSPIVEMANKMISKGEKKTHVVQYLASKHNLSARSIYYAINRLNREVFN